MYKYLTTNIDSDNIISVSLENEKEFIKTAAKRDFPAEVDHAIKNLARKKDHSYILTTAMGSGEIWGSNSNADHFPYDALTGMQNDAVDGEFAPKDERLDPKSANRKRYLTFTDASFFKHHKNKLEKGDPSFGYVPHSFWFPKMNTVLLIIGVDRRLAPDTAAKIDAGELVNVSMGAKVPYDVCMVCGNKAKNVFQYCDHIKFNRNQIMPDGKRAALKNLHPRFFDISEVTKPAFLAGVQLEKVASSLCDLSCDLADQYNLGAYDKQAEDKFADIKKSIPLHVEGAIAKLSDTEHDLPKQLLDHLATLKPQEAWGALIKNGIIAKPNEFAYILLKHGGKDKEAHEFLGAHATLKHDANIEDIDANILHLGQIDLNHKALQMASSMPDHVIADRSVNTLTDRIYEMDKGHRKEAAISKIIGLGAILSALYLFYRGNVASISAEGLLGAGVANMLMPSSDTPKGYIGNNYAIEESLNKKAGFQGNVLKAGAGFAVPYILQAHYQQKANQGMNPGVVGNFVSHHAGSLGILGAATALGPKTVGKGALNLGKGLVTGLKTIIKK